MDKGAFLGGVGCVFNGMDPEGICGAVMSED